MRTLTELQASVDGLDLPGAIKRLEEVASWPAHPSQYDSISRQTRALELRARLQGVDGPAWLDFAKGWLHKLCSDYQSLCSTWEVE